jgi:transcriptional regulator with XRE-family HTH domain
MTEQPDEPDEPPVGVLIKRALVTAGLSQRAAAKRAKISETRWRQIAAGYQVINKQRVADPGPGGTLARMARVVDVTPEELDAVDRPDAAAALREIIEAEAEAGRAALADTGAATGPQSRVDERWHMLEALLRQARAGLTPPEYATLAARVTAFVATPPDDPSPPAA